ncbi:MAG TPA: 4a-hydroxytetrahydrobiopterin dehydratase [Verrucomicrobiae bacterium]|nr:4a-hydroxytetrahydrobiopterin dehydratase [Verrucomicrobiae bacterium]
MPQDISAETLSSKKCRPCEGKTQPMTSAEITSYLEHVPGWEYRDGQVQKTFTFKNYYQTTAFVNAVAWIAHQEDHHPDIQFGYKNCTVRYSTHAIGGISENDFICAAKVNALTAV